MLKLWHWRLLFLIGSILPITGSNMPWWCRGDLGWFCTRSVQLISDRMSTSRDDAGLFMIILTITCLLLVYFAPKFVRYPSHLFVPGVVTLFLISSYNLIFALILYYQDRRVTSYGGFTPQIGLYLVHFGILVMLFSTAAIILSGKEPPMVKRLHTK